MKPMTENGEYQEKIIAALLWYGTWFACVLIAVGILLTAIEPFHDIGGYHAVRAGVAVFILLPVARVALMLIIFVRECDYAYAVIAAFVLAIIATGALIGLSLTPTA